MKSQTLPTFSMLSMTAICAMYVVLMVVLQSAGVYLAARLYFGALDTESLLSQGSQNGTVVACSVLFSAIILSGVSLLGVALKTKTWTKSKQFLGIRAFMPQQGCAALLLLLVLLFIIKHTTELLNKEPMAFMDALLDTHSLWPMVFAVVVVAPIYEELIFRGVIFEVLARPKPRSDKPSRRSIIGAGIVSSALFALVHFQYDWYGLLLIFVIALFFCYVKVRYGLLLAILLHIINNAITMVVYLLTTDYFVATL